MRLTIKEIKQIIKEELDNLLNENQQSIEALAKKFLERTEKEPEAWKQEYDQYLSMLRNKQYEDLLSLLEGDEVGYEIFAYMLVNLEQEIRAIPWWYEIQRNFPNFFSLYEQFYVDKFNLVSSERADELENIMGFVDLILNRGMDVRSIREHELWRLRDNDDDTQYNRDKEYFDRYYVNTLGWYEEHIDYEADNFYTPTDKFYQDVYSILRYLISRVGFNYQMPYTGKWGLSKVDKLFERETGITFPFEFNGTKYENLQETAWFILDLYWATKERIISDPEFQRDLEHLEHDRLVLQDITKKLGYTPPASEENEYGNDGFGGFYVTVESLDYLKPD